MLGFQSAEKLADAIHEIAPREALWSARGEATALGGGRAGISESGGSSPPHSTALRAKKDVGYGHESNPRFPDRRP
jgi:hypothetical protein